MENMNALQGLDIVIGFHHFLADRAIHLFFFPLFFPLAYFIIILGDILEGAVWRHKAWFCAVLVGCSRLFSVRCVEELIVWYRVNYQSDFVPRRSFRNLRAVFHILVRIDYILSFLTLTSWIIPRSLRMRLVMAHHPLDAANTVFVLP